MGILLCVLKAGHPSLSRIICFLRMCRELGIELEIRESRDNQRLSIFSHHTFCILLVPMTSEKNSACKK